MMKPSTTRNKLVIKAYFFNWAGGTSRIYSSLKSAIGKKCESCFGDGLCLPLSSESICYPFFTIEPISVDLPGRLVRSTERAIINIPELAAVLIEELFSKCSDHCKPYILFGHSYGSIVAYEVAKQIEERKMHGPMVLFVSASRPPSSVSLTSHTSKPVSMMNFEEMVDYFQDRGSTICIDDFNDDEMKKLFVDSVKVDYKGLEEYVSNDSKISCAIFAIGGDEDVIVSEEQITAWKQHQKYSDITDNNEVCEEKKNDFESHILTGRGHFYLNDSSGTSTSDEIAGIVVAKLGKLLWKEVQEIASDLKDIFRQVLNIPSTTASLGPQSDFFLLGGSSLDTVNLIAQIRSSLNVLVTQNEIFLNPKIMDLALRIKDIQSLRKDEAPILVPVDDSEAGGTFFPASYGQEQMVSCWEMSPAMYNMPTTIEFIHDGIDIPSLRSALHFVVVNQPSLRTIVKVDITTNQITQCVLPVSRADKCMDIKIVEVNSETDAKHTIESESGFVFPLYDTPVVRAVVVKVAASKSDLLLLNQHHVGSDGWSRTIFRRQLLQAYISIRKKGTVVDDERDLVIPPHPNYIDWTIWSRRWLLDHNQQEKQLEYWKKKLEGLPVLDLPTDKPRPSVLTSRGMRIPIIIDASLTKKFTSIVVERGANLYAGLISLYVLMLHKMGGGDDFSIGIALANRHHEGLQNLIGYFANEVAIRAEFGDSVSYADILSNIYQNVLESMAHADTPFHKVTEALRVPRSSNRTSVFQAMFALQEREWHSVDDLSEGHNQFRLKQFNHNTSKFEVHLQLRHDGEGGLEGDLHIATDLFTEDSGKRMVSMYQKLMDSCVENPDRNIHFHDMTPAFDKILATTSNNTSKEHSINSIFHFFSMNPELIALYSIDKSITYGELRSLISSAAQYLSSSVGVKAKDKVGLVIKSSVLSLASIFGVVMTGCAVVILDAEKIPVKRCQAIFDDAAVSAVIVESEFLATFRELRKGAWKFVVAEHLFCSFEQTSIQYMDANPDPKSNDVFGIYYTSGSTGMPKGVIITHGNILNLVNWWKSFFDLNPEDNVLLFSSLSFIMSLRQYVPTLCSGGTVVIPSSSIEFESAIKMGKVNKLICTPSALAALDVDTASESIDYVQVAGEAPQLSTMIKWGSRVKKLFIGLGPTELCAHALCGEFDGRTISIGYPADNVKAYVVDAKSGIPCPVNVPGELWVSGKNVSNGYFDSKELSDRKFCLDPFEHVSPHRLYKTGDLAKRLADGRIQFLGRRDSQLKVNGFRIESGEIINAVPSYVDSAHVMVLGNKLTLFVTPKVDINQVKTTLVEALPSYLIPSSIYAIDKFPLNKNRKLDSNALLEIVRDTIQSKPEKDMSYDAQELSFVEIKVALIWAQQLCVSVKSIQKESNFFELGGTSLSAVTVSRALEEEFGIVVGVVKVFQHQTLSRLAEFLSKASDQVQFSDDPKPLRFLSGGSEELHPVLFSMAQGLGLLLMSIIATIPLFTTAFLSTRSFIWFGNIGIVLFPAFVVGGCFIHLLLISLSKWVIIGKFQEGKAKKFSWFFLKWWLVRRILQVPRLYTWIFDETILSSAYLRILGANIGSNVHVEQPYLLEPDLVSVGDNCVAEFEVQFATSEIRGDYLELRKVHIGNNVKVGVRAILLGGTTVHDGCEVGAKAILDFSTSSTGPCQMLPSPIDQDKETDGEIWRPNRGWLYNTLQIISCFIMLEIFTGIGFIGTSIGMIINVNHGSIGLVVYLGTLFPIISCVLLLLIAALLKRLLMPFKIVPGKVYEGDWFAIRKWFLDRLFLSPLFSYCSQRTLQTSSTFPWYLRLLGTKSGKRAWFSHPNLRGVGTELISIGDDVHMGMQSYFSTERYNKNGISFHPINIGLHSSLGQRCVCLSGVTLDEYVTVGAETLLPHDFHVGRSGSTFGSPPVSFTSSAQFNDIVNQSQDAARRMLEGAQSNTDGEYESVSTSEQTTQEGTPNQVSRMQDIGTGKYFWRYVCTMIFIQGCIPLIIGTAYGGIYFGVKIWIGDIQFEYILAMIPVIYIIGSIMLMIMMKLMYIFGGSFKIGTANFFSFRFFYWHIFVDVVYLVTSTIIYPFSGTELYCIWLRSMGAKIGKRVFISPENGGFRELDFLSVGNNCCLMTPNIHGHYIDHGVLQFCPIKLEDGCAINAGATIMPLTSYGKECQLRPFAVTVKGQHCKEKVRYVGNPCKEVKSSLKTAILFGGQGSQYPGMLEHFNDCSQAIDLLEKAQQILGMENIRQLCSIDSNPAQMRCTKTVQIIVTVANLMAAELMRQKVPVDFSKVVACAGFSLGELSALCFSGAISFEDTLRLVKLRAQAMAECEGAMCSLRGMLRGEVETLCRQFSCSIANIISDHSDTEKTEEIVRANNVFVCAGSEEAIGRLIESVNKHNVHDEEQRGATTAKVLKVSGAFHTAYMEKAKQKFADGLDSIDIKLPEKYLVYSNVTGKPYRSVQQIRKLLPLQIISPVKWHHTIVDMAKIEGIEKFIECGPTDTLTKTVKLIIPGVSNDNLIVSDFLHARRHLDE